ncbi:copper resistance protein CopC [Nonomuraea sp. NPDC048916]|uniref:copper resistance CopC family protein n=1 Tax=Nonomuraea sp. NPDC048916 TaxID=3154232 RepID=UPI00340E5E3F
MKRTLLAALTATFAALLVIGAAVPALAHDALKRSDPAKDATVKTIDEVTLEFTAKVRMPFVIVRGADGAEHQLGAPATDGSVVKQQLRGVLPDGKYTIAYRVVSSDGHPVEGEIPFAVKGAPPSAEPSSEPSAEPAAQQSAPPVTSPSVEPSAEPTAGQETQPDATRAASQEQPSTAFPVWLLVVVGALAGIGVGFLLSMRKKKP